MEKKYVDVLLDSLKRPYSLIYKDFNEDEKKIQWIFVFLIVIGMIFMLIYGLFFSKGG